MIAIVAAVWEELGPLLKAYSFQRIDGPADAHAYRGLVGNVPGSQVDALALLAGIGRERSEEATAWLVRNFSLDAILAVGFAGATRDSLATGVLVLATRLTHLEGMPLEWSRGTDSEVIEPDPDLLTRARSAVELEGIDYVQGPAVTLPIIARSAGLKRWLGDTFGVYAVDLESYWIAQTAKATGVPFLAARVVVDPTAITLPGFVSEVPRTPRGGRTGPAIAYAARDPRRVVDLIRLRSAASVARRQIAAFVAAFVRSDIDGALPGAGEAAA